MSVWADSTSFSSGDTAAPPDPVAAGLRFGTIFTTGRASEKTVMEAEAGRGVREGPLETVTVTV